MSWLSSALKGVTKTVSSVGPLASLIPGAGPWVAGLGALSSMQAGQDAERAARRADSQGRGLEERATRIWDLLFANAQKAESEGQFDPERRIAALEKATAGYEAKDMGNLAGALRVTGYRPGDSEIGTRLDDVKLKYRKYLDQARDDIRVRTFQEKQDAYALPMQYLQPGLQGAQNRGNVARSDAAGTAGGLAGFAQAIMPLLNRPKTTPTVGAKTTPTNYGFSLGTGNFMNFKPTKERR
jgi:hypothetical protein